MTVLEMTQKNSPGATGESKLSAERIDQIRQRLTEHQSNTGVSDATVAKRCAPYQKSTIQLWRTNRYPGDASNVARAVELYLDLDDQQRAIGLGPEFVATAPALKIQRAILKAEAAQKIAVIATQSGLGKTRTIFAYRARNPKAIYVSCSPDLKRPWSLLGELIYVLTKEPARRDPAYSRRELVAMIQGTNRTLLIDEAQFLDPASVELLRCIQDQSGVALILCGNETIYEHGAARIGGMAAHAQFTSRVVARVHLTLDDITEEDVSAIATQMVPRELAGSVIELLAQEARAGGGFRSVVTILQLAQMSAGTGGRVTKAHVVRAIAELKDFGSEE